MIKIITGVPGAGKTLFAVSQIVEARKAGRIVYVAGLDGLDPSLGCLPFDPNEWEALPDGSMCVIDEAQKWWPTRMRGDPIPPVRALSEHRHRGFDFILITQKPTMLDSWVRGLCGEHAHVERKFGTHVAGIRTWAECIEDTSSNAQREKAMVMVWRYPPELFKLYKSATIHTHKAKLPARAFIVMGALVALPIAAWLYFGSVEALKAGDLAQVEKQTPSPARADAQRPAATGSVLPSRDRAPITVEDYVASITPRIEGMPWSAPIFDGQKPTSMPRIACIIAAASCRCYTEQATRIHMEFDRCSTIARFGIYRPGFDRGDA